MSAPLIRPKRDFPGCCTPCECVCTVMSHSGRPASGSTDRIQKLRKEYYQARREGFTLYEDDEGRARLDYDLHWVSPGLILTIEFISTDIVSSRGTWLRMFYTYQAIFSLLEFHRYEHYPNHSHLVPQKLFT